MKPPKKSAGDKPFPPALAKARRDETLKRLLHTPPTPHKSMPKRGVVNRNKPKSDA